MNTIFNTKDQYISMRAAWATFINSDEAKPYKDETYGTQYHRVFGWHFALYAILRGKDARKHFANDESYETAIDTLKQRMRWKKAETARIFGITEEQLTQLESTINAL